MNKKIKEYQGKIQDFGLWFVLKNYYSIKAKKHDMRISMVYDFLSDELKELIQEYQKIPSFPRGEKKKTVWVCWWQGYEKMPELCRICVDRLQAVLPEDYTLVFLSKDNYAQYVTLPPMIIERMESGVLPIPQFCDILRHALIYFHGGTWIDASVWTNESLFDCLNESHPFWSLKLHGIHDTNVVGQRISQCKWASFLLSGEKGSLLSKFVYEGMCLHYTNYRSTVEYFTQNVIIRIGYDRIPEIRKIIDEIPESNSHMYDLFGYMNTPFDTAVWEKLNADTGAFKLTQKKTYCKEINGKKTFYGYLTDSRKL